MNPVKIWDRTIGDSFSPYFVAELGTCHEGSLEIAKENVRAAVAAGADCIKSELFYETEVKDPSARKTYTINGKKHSVPLIEHMRRYQFTLEQHHEIKLLCDELKVPFMATAHDWDRVDFLVEIGAAAVKIASPDIVFYPLIDYVAQSGLVLFLDTGGAYQHEVELAVKTARDAGCNRLIVNHNPEGHPAPADKHDLRIINRFKELFETPIGLSDHYDGYQMMYAAVAVGANVIEKPISRDRFIEACEHNWSISRNDLPEVIKTIHDVYAALGRKQRTMAPGVRPGSSHRVALVAKKDLDAGTVIDLENITFGKPRMGIGVEDWHLVKGRTLRTEKKGGSFIQWTDL